MTNKEWNKEIENHTNGIVLSLGMNTISDSETDTINKIVSLIGSLTRWEEGDTE